VLSIIQICVAMEWRCDGDDDCGDGSDETENICHSIDCPADKRFRCNNYKCIPRWRLCDKVDNCGDGSDENNHDLCEITFIFFSQSHARMRIPYFHALVYLLWKSGL
jgi:Low-density lipoprotein receptor domain class A